MSLTSRPFARLAALDEVDRQDSPNVASSERSASALMGGLLVAGGLLARSRAGLLLSLLGGGLLYRGVTGRCHLYRVLGIDTAHPHRQRGVLGNRGIKVEAVEHVNKPAESLFRYWRRLDNLPKFMPHIVSIDESADGTSHWVVRGPLNRTLEWDAEIIEEKPGTMLSWQTLPDAEVASAGSVWFEPEGAGTRVKVSLQYHPPAGEAGAMVASLLGASPAQQIREDLARFKELAESKD